MAKCRFKIRWGAREWECPLEALPGEEYCYWHKEEEGKEPDDAQLRELKENEIRGAFLRKAKLSEKELQEALLWDANLQRASLRDANLQGADLEDANLQEADLENAKLQGAYLPHAKLQGANLLGANLQRTHLYKAELQGAVLSCANLQGTDLSYANLEGANLIGVKADSETCLDRANLTYANLYRSYLDETKTLRNAEFKSEKEINEIVADFIKRRNKDLAVLDVRKIRWDNSEVVAKLLEEGLVRYVPVGEPIMDRLDRVFIYVYGGGPIVDKLFMYVPVGEPIVFFDRERRRVVKNPENAKSNFFQRLRKRRNSEEKGDYVEISELNNLIERNGLEKYLYEGSREKLKELYEASYEVYNNLYYFYIQNGRLEKALDMHYRRCEVRRKLLREQGWIKCLRSWIFDFFILKLLTGYGVDFLRPLIALVIIFVCHLWLMNGLVSQVLAAAESFMKALLIFTITYRVSR